MQDNVAVSDSSANQKINSSKRRFVFLGIQIGAIILILIFILFALNFLNIFRLDSLIHPLTLLPRQQGQVTPVAIPSVGPELQQVQDFKYDNAKATKLVTDYINQFLKPEYKNNDPINKMDPEHSVGNLPNYGKYWKKGADTLIGDVIFVPGTNNVMDVHLLVLKGNRLFGIGTPSSLNASQAQQLLQNYFIVSPTNIKCTTNNNKQTSCENFSQSGDVKSGYGAALDASNPKNIRYGIFACQIFKNSPNFDQATSCVGPNSL